LVQTAPLFISSGDLIADRRYDYARELEKRGDLAGAADLYTQAVETAPGFASAWFALGEVRARLGDNAGAAAAYQAARDHDPQDRHGAALHLARLNGETIPMPPGYVRALFDQYAPQFDFSLTQGLDYRAPALLFQAVKNTLRDAGRPARFEAMLDLGCGTGLGAAPFRAQVKRLVGVDLSAGMIAQARKKALYDRLEIGELIEFLAAEADAATTYDLVIAADVFVYLPDLAAMTAAVRRVLTPLGLFAFTVETHDGDGVLLRDTLRYAHAAAHVRGAIEDAGLSLVHLQEAATRTEKNRPVPGLVAVASASTAPRSIANSAG
jgi:predicted TPR repeat methyltransferase